MHVKKLNATLELLKKSQRTVVLVGLVFMAGITAVFRINKQIKPKCIFSNIYAYGLGIKWLFLLFLLLLFLVCVFFMYCFVRSFLVHKVTNIATYNANVSGSK